MNATPVPITSPANTATVAMNPLNTRWMMTMIASVPMAYARFLLLVGSGLAPPPTASNAATGNRAIPMMVITVPVTTGGKNLINFAK